LKENGVVTKAERLVKAVPLFHAYFTACPPGR